VVDGRDVGAVGLGGAVSVAVAVAVGVGVAVADPGVGDCVGAVGRVELV
jgi:hypothetical protein